MQTYHSGLFTAFEHNLKRRWRIDDMLDKLYVLQQCANCRKAVVPKTRASGDLK